MSLATRLTALAQAVGADIKALTELVETDYDYAIRFGQGTSTSVPYASWTVIPLGAPVNKSPLADDALRVNADGTVTILLAGWYLLYNTLASIAAITSGAGVQHGWWWSAADVTPANPGASMREEHPSPNNIGFLGTETGAVYLPAGYRIGASVYSRDLTTRSFASTLSTIARIGSGPSGPKGDKGEPGEGSALPLVSTLPSEPYDGQQVLYQSPTMAITNRPPFHLRYRSNSLSEYKWEVVSGELFASASMSSLAANVPGLSLPIPLPGYYWVGAGLIMQSQNTAGGGRLDVVKPGGGTPFAGSTARYDSGSQAGFWRAPGVSEVEAELLAGNMSATVVDISGAQYYFQTWLRAKPIRLKAA